MPIKRFVPKFRQEGQVLCRCKKIGAVQDIASHQALEDDKNRKTPLAGGLGLDIIVQGGEAPDFIDAVSLSKCFSAIPAKVLAYRDFPLDLIQLQARRASPRYLPEAKR